MQFNTTVRLGLTFAGALTIFCGSSEAAVFTSTGAAPADIQGTIDAFRAALGPNNGVGGSFATGRREINWDGVPLGFASPNALPGNFFNANSPRGAVLSTPGAELRVSANAGEGPVEFGDVNASYPDLFQTFSAQRLFAPIGSNIVQIDFFVPGTNTPGVVAGFGAVFTDVNLPAGALFTLTLGDGSSGGQFAVPAGPAGGLSFLGLTDPRGYSRIIIQSGTVAFGANQVLTNNQDVVAMDDFIFGEPQAAAIPEPGSVFLTLLGGGALAAMRRRLRA